MARQSRMNPRRVKFDVALTVSAMRYISDLHLGMVDPKTYIAILIPRSINMIWRSSYTGR